MGKPSKNSTQRGFTARLLNLNALCGSFLEFMEKSGWIEIQISEYRGTKFLLTEEGRKALSSEPYNLEIPKILEYHDKPQWSDCLTD